MKIQPVAYPYAKALLELAAEQGQLERMIQDAGVVVETCAASPELRTILKSPVIRPDAKQRILAKVFEGKLGGVVPLFVEVLLRKGRASLLPDIAAAVQQIGDEHLGIVPCKLTTATKLTREEVEQLRRITEKRFPGKTIRIQEVIDPTIIGGGIIQVGDLQWDASVRTKLHVIKRAFAQNPYIPKL